MNFSQILATATLALVSALVLVQAGQYGGNNYQSAGRAQERPYGAIASHYPSGSGSGSGCQGYQCGARANRSPYGPYHSYAVRPVVYGGHGLYSYQGYARHQPAPASHGARYARSYGAGPRRGARSTYGGCYGPHCNRGPARHYGPARAAPYRQQSYALRPVKVVALAPSRGSYGGSHGGSYGGSQGGYNAGYNAGYNSGHNAGHNAGYNNGYNTAHNAGYNNAAAGHHSSQYSAPARYNEQRHHRQAGSY